jgi:rod shape-determining protein MreC
LAPSAAAIVGQLPDEMNRPVDRRPWTFFLLLGLTILILALHETGQLTLVEDVLSLVTGPVQRALSGLVGGARDAASTVGDARELRNQVEELERTVNEMAAQSVRQKEVEVENTQLRELLNFVSANPSLHGFVGGDVIGHSGVMEGEVIGQDPNPYIFFLIINRGDRDGLKVGMPVVAGGGRLVGRVAEVNPRWSKVQLLIDPGSRVNGVIQVSRATGLAAGQPDGSLYLEQVSQSELVDVGDTVVTSGRGGLMPKGLIIGQIAEIEKLDIELYQRALLRPAVDFGRIEVVLILTDFEPSPLDESSPETGS